ncbi:MAG TPA: glycosyltransferase [Candidatus Acidoferrales bacterium]|nr:glycosyltransferase [Candidatus Acidoferrales bacterium]
MRAKADSRINVLHVGKFYPPHVGGMESHVATLCRELTKTMNVRALVANDKPRDEDSIIDGVSVSRLAIHLTIAGAPVCTTMAWRLRRAAADIVHVHLPNPAGVIAVMASGYKGKLIATWHSDVVRQRRLAQIFAPIQRRFLRKCSAIIATSPNYVESSTDLANFRDRCHVIPFGINADELRRHDPRAVQAIRDRYPGPLLLAVGRFVYYKGFEYLIRAMKQVDARLLLIGDGPLRHSLQQEASALGVAGRVIFPGALSDITPYYHACDAFVLPSVTRSEAFGIVQLEAMACGRPVVNTSIASGVPFVSVDGVTGITVAPCDVEALSGAINRLLADAKMRERYGKAAKQRVENEFSAATMLRRTRDLYEGVLSGAVSNGATVHGRMAVAPRLS